MKEYIVLSTDDATLTPDGGYLFRMLRPLRNVKSLRIAYAALPKTGKFLTTDLNLRVQGGSGLNTTQKATSVDKNENNDPVFNFLGRLQFQDTSVGSFVDLVVKEALKWGTVPQFIFNNDNDNYMKYIFKPTLSALNQVRIRFDNEKSPLDQQYTPVINVFSLGAKHIDAGDTELPDDEIVKFNVTLSQNPTVGLYINSDISLLTDRTPQFLFTFYETLARQTPIIREVYMAHLYAEGVDDSVAPYSNISIEDVTYQAAVNSPWGIGPWANPLFPLYSGKPVSSKITSDSALIQQLDKYYTKLLFDSIHTRNPRTMFEITDYSPYTTDSSSGIYTRPLVFTTKRIGLDANSYLTTQKLFSGTVYKFGWNVHSDFPNNFTDPWMPRAPNNTTPLLYEAQYDYHKQFMTEPITLENFASYAFDYQYYVNNGFNQPSSSNNSELVNIAKHAAHGSGTRCIFVPDDNLRTLLSSFNTNAARYLFLSIFLRSGRIRAKYLEKKGSVTLQRYEFYSVKRIYLPESYHFLEVSASPRSSDPLELTRAHPAFMTRFVVAIELDRELLPKAIRSSSGMDSSDIIKVDVDITFADRAYEFKGSNVGIHSISIDTYTEMSFPAALTLEAEVEEPSCFLGICN